jgi:peptide/nickel transport system substrate-binding protein
VHAHDRRTRRPFSLVLLVVALILTACQSGGADSTSSTQGPTAATARQNVDLAVPPAADDPNAKTGGTLKLSMSQDPLCLDGDQVSSAAIQLLGRLYYDNLTALDAKGDPTPWLAKSWDVTNGGKRYTFHLRQGVTFSDGTAFDAAAVAANFAHMRAPETKSPLSAAYIAPISRTKVVDDYTLQVDLRYAYSPLLYVLAQGWLGMLSPKQISGDFGSLCSAPIGTGPYTVESYTQGKGVTLVRRKDYNWSAAYLHHKGAAYIDRIEISFVAEPSVRYNSLSSGEFDATDNIAPQNAAAVKGDSSITYHNIARIGNPQRLIFNTERAPFNDIAVRRAFAEAIDVDGIAQAVGFGEYAPEHAFLSPTTKYYDASAEKSWVTDLDAANKALDQAGWAAKDADGYRTKNGKRLVASLPVAESATPTPLNDLIQAEGKKIGIEVQIEQLPQAEATQRRQQGDYDLATGVWHTNTPDGLYICYASGEITTALRIGQNTSRLRDAKLDRLLLRARQTDASDAKTLAVLYKQAQQRLAALVPAVPLYDFYTPWAVRTNVHGVLADSSHGTPLFTLAWIGD